MKPYDTGCLLLSTYLGYIPHIPPVQWPTLRHPSISGERDSKRNSQRGPICWKNGRRRCVPGGFSFRSFPSFFWGQTSERSVELTTPGLDQGWMKTNKASMSHRYRPTRKIPWSTPLISACQERRDVQSGNFDVRLPSKDFESGKSSWSSLVDWFGTRWLFLHILGLVVPTDFHIFHRSWTHQPVLI